MNKFEFSPNPPTGNDDLPETTRARDPTRGETAPRQKRSRAPQFGSDRRNQRDMDSRQQKTARHHGDANGLQQHSSDRGRTPERRMATQDRRQSYY